MESDVLNDMTHYIDFLRQNGYSVVVSAPHKVFTPCMAVLMDYEIHLPSVCNFLKSHPRTAGKCISHKRRFEKTDFPGLCYRCCYAGVEEYVYPVYLEGKRILCIHLSGFRGQISQAQRLAQRWEERCGPGFAARYQELTAQVPPPETAEALAAPLAYMAQALYRECQAQADAETPAQRLCRKVRAYLYENYSNPLRSRDIAAALGYSESHLRAVFLAQTGITPGRQLQQIRLSRAAVLLTKTDLPVTDIALACGFDSANYFSTAFRREYGKAPSQWRK